MSLKNLLLCLPALGGAANSLALLQKEKAPFGIFVIDEFRRGHVVREERLAETGFAERVPERTTDRTSCVLPRLTFEK